MRIGDGTQGAIGVVARAGQEAYTRGILSCLAHWGMLPAKYLLPTGGRACAGAWQMSRAEGLFVAHCQIGDQVATGQLLAEIRTPRGQVLQSFHADAVSGTVLAIRSKAYIRPENWGVFIAHNI